MIARRHRRLRKMAQLLLMLLVAANGVAAELLPALPPAALVGGGELRVQLSDRLLSVHARNVSLGEVLNELARLAGFRLVAYASLNDRVDLAVEAQPLTRR
jgi:tRNA(Phe) wybutosine-synthesizing methylase Tyw3